MEQQSSSESPSIDNLVDLFKKSIIGFNRTANSGLEFEIRFGNESKGKKHQKDKDFINRLELRIDQNVYENVYKKLHSFGFTTSQSEYQMKITPEFVNDKGRLQRSNIRIEIQNLTDIQSFCKTSNLPPLENVKFVIKSHHIEEFNRPFYNNIFGFRTSIQKESTLSRTSDTVKNITDSGNWNSSNKTFRYIHRSSLTNTNLKHIRVDMSIVKQNYHNKQIRFKDSGVIQSKPDFEIEIELVDVTKYSDFELISNNLKKTIKYVLSGVQNTNYPKKLNEIERVIKNYYTLKQSKLYDFNKRISKDFIGPSSVTLQKQNLVKHENINNVSIQDDFCVTDKADGERKMLYISNNGEIYFITTNMNFEYTGCDVTNRNLFGVLIDGEHIENDKFNNSINYYAAFDLYYCSIKKRNGVDIRGYKFFVIIDETTSEEDRKINKYTRYRLLDKTIKEINESIRKNGRNTLNIDKKEFIFSNPNKNVSIFDCCSSMLSKINSNIYKYNTDGIIFTSKILGVTQEHAEDEIKNKKYSWKHSFKWKPPQYNTIDFLIEIKKDQLNELDVKTKMINGEITQYYEVNLKVGFDVRQHRNKQTVILNLDFENKEFYSRFTNEYYKPELFYPTNPSDENAHICHIPVKRDEYGKINIFTEENDLILDDSIVEFSYEFNKKDKFLCWKPLRVRYDKTSEYKSGGNNFGNAYHVANNNWQSIHNPITENILSGKEEITLEMINEESEDIYYNGMKSESKTRNLRDFHNLFVKRLLIDIVSLKQPKTKLIDMAVGKGGDLPKWCLSKLYAVLGIDLSKDNIYNDKNGACNRFITSYERNKKMPICMFIHGDTSKLIHNGDFTKVDEDINSSLMEMIQEPDEEKAQEEKVQEIEEEQEKENISNVIMNSLMGHGNKGNIKYPFLKKHFGLFNDKFDICSIQFALHYMFEDKTKLHSFLCNVSNYTKKGKYFIGTCYDGKKVYEILEQIEQGERVEKYIDEQKIWHIKKKYNDEERLFMNDDENSVGLKISVYQESINKEFDEYLVNFDYFIKLMKDYGFELSDPMLYKSKLINPIGNFEDLYENMMNDESKLKFYKEAKNMSDEEKYISFMNNYFIFQKVNDVNTELLYNHYIFNNEDEVLDYNIEKAEKTNIRLKLSMS